MNPIQVRLPKKLIEELDKVVEEKGYPNRSEFIRHAVRSLVDYSNENKETA